MPDSNSEKEYRLKKQKEVVCIPNTLSKSVLKHHASSSVTGINTTAGSIIALTGR